VILQTNSTGLGAAVGLLVLVGTGKDMVAAVGTPGSVAIGDG
jgi:hypothetical protein